MRKLSELHRFNDRVQDYLRSRPGYPRQVLDVLRGAMGVAEPASIADWRLSWTVADIGAGTGLLSLPLLEAGCTVYGVEPSAEMRTAAAQTLKRFPEFSVLEGQAEATGLDEGSMDLVVAGQAFHWFDAEAAAREWRRILKPGGTVALVWNRRRALGTPFAVAYETFLRSWGTDYAEVAERYEDPAGLGAVLGEVPEPTLLPNRQRLDRLGLQARLRSCSYLPGQDDERFEAMMHAASGLFDAHQVGGIVELTYDTAVYAGPVPSADGP